MADPQLVLCGGLTAADAPAEWRAADPVRLATGGGRLDVHLRLDRLTRRLQVGVPDVEADLLEVAAYAYAADQCASRGGTRAVDYGDAWRRRFRFEVPVRRPDVWGRADVRDALAAALGFLTDDGYEFHFHPAVARNDPTPTLFDHLPSGAGEFAAVALFSGGLDSLCGAAEAVLGRGERVVLVSHRSSTRVAARQEALFEAVRVRATGPAAPVHVGVTLNKGEDLTRDTTQRCRSFAFAAIAAVVARRVGLGEVRFYENGVTSLNLPVSPELVGARASRTTHPQALARFARLFSLLFDAPFAVTNPFQWDTKAELLSRLRVAGHADLCAMTCSCAHVWGVKEDRPHCGVCSQCVDRRVSALAAGLPDAEDPPGRYVTDPLTGARAGADLTYAERYVGAAWEAERIPTPVAFAARYPEVLAAAPHTGLSTDAAVAAAHDLLRRHGAGVGRAVAGAIAANADGLYRQDVPATSLLGLAVGRARSAPAEPAPPPPPDLGLPPAEPGLVVDPAMFEVRLGGRACPLGNTNGFRLMERLYRARGVYLPVAALGEDVWGDASVSRNAVQRTVSALRTRLRECGLDGVEIDGSQKEHYRLVVPPG